jgi:transcriptional regulator with XRE-family HTH domain
MRYDRFKQELAKAGLSVREFADEIGVNATTVSNYATRDRVPTHFAVIVTLMAAMKENGLDFQNALAGLDRRKHTSGTAEQSAQRAQQSLFWESSGAE